MHESDLKKVIYSVGHSTHSIERFIDLLKLHSVTAVADVRSSPYSRVNLQFNRETLADTLRSHGVAYVFLGRELGARSSDPSCCVGGKVRYELLAQTQLFEHGIMRLMDGALRHRVALMCAEKDPIECHRAILVSRILGETSVQVRHILADGRIETQEELGDRLLRKLNVETDDLFSSKEQLVQNAFRTQGIAIAYEVPPGSDPGSGFDEHRAARQLGR
jgi:uncharacterized protein (DUF488 family)